MNTSHKIAEEKYRNIRSIAYEITMEELPYQDKKSILLSEITDSAIFSFNSLSRQHERKVDWDWKFGAQMYRNRYPNRFELAVWYNNTVCGLSLGRPSYNGTRVRLDFIERVSGANALKGRVTPIAVTAYEVYARLIGASQVRIIRPAEALITYYSSLNYIFVRGSNTNENPDYLYKTLEG
jgi:hypothetical protein